MKNNKHGSRKKMMTMANDYPILGMGGGMYGKGGVTKDGKGGGRDGMGGGDNDRWIQSANIDKGALREALGIKKGKTIPEKVLNKLSKQKTEDGKPTKMAKRANLAKTFKKLSKKKNS